MARNQPFDFSDEDDLIASGGTNATDAEYSESGWADSPDMTSQSMGRSSMDETGRHATQKARQQSQTATHTRSSAEPPDSPTSMNKKRGNQPR
jgi:hypothetical protein